jgi:hypothetical protein
METNNSIFENLKTEETETPYLQRLVINLIDWIIEVSFFIGFIYLFPKDFIANLLSLGPYMKYVLAFAFIMVYRLICVLSSGKTVGMMVCKSKYLDSKQQPLSSIQRLSAAFAPKVFGIKYFKA